MSLIRKNPTTYRIAAIYIDPDVCTCSQLCVKECPEVLDGNTESGVPKVKEGAEKYFLTHAEKIVSACEVCPVDAIALKKEAVSSVAGVNRQAAAPIALASIETRWLLVGWCVAWLLAYAIAWAYSGASFVAEPEATWIYSSLVISLIGTSGFILFLIIAFVRHRSSIKRCSA